MTQFVALNIVLKAKTKLEWQFQLSLINSLNFKLKITLNLPQGRRSHSFVEQLMRVYYMDGCFPESCYIKPSRRADFLLRTRWRRFANDYTIIFKF